MKQRTLSQCPSKKAQKSAKERFRIKIASHPTRKPHSAYQKAVQGKCPLHVLRFNGAICSNTLFSNTSALTNSLLFSGRKKEPKPKLFGPDIFQWGRGLPRERVGDKKFDTSLETREIKLFGRDIPGFCRDIPEVPDKLEKKKFVFNFRSLYLGQILHRKVLEHHIWSNTSGFQ